MADGWLNPIPSGLQTRGFAPASTSDAINESAMYADDALRKAHDADYGPNGNGNGPFPGSTYYPDFHAALDIYAPIGTAILAPQAGLVLDAKWGGPGSWANGGGLFFRVGVNDECMYLGAHCSQLLVRAGERVRQGQVIARVGQTGVATGPHLHFTARLGPAPYYDPRAFFWNPALVLPGGPLYGDSRFAPGGNQIPDTSLIPYRIDGDPHPMKGRSEIRDGRTARRTLKANKPIRETARVTSGKLQSYPERREIECFVRIDVETQIDRGLLPASEREYGDIFGVMVYVPGGDVVGYVKQVDLAGN